MAGYFHMIWVKLGLLRHKELAGFRTGHGKSRGGGPLNSGDSPTMLQKTKGDQKANW